LYYNFYMTDIKLTAGKNYLYRDHPGSLRGVPDGAPRSMKGDAWAPVPGAQTREILLCEIFEFHVNTQKG
jgi:hypothetical protein